VDWIGLGWIRLDWIGLVVLGWVCNSNVGNLVLNALFFPVSQRLAREIINSYWGGGGLY
jgi:hypothetical protein